MGCKTTVTYKAVLMLGAALGLCSEAMAQTETQAQEVEPIELPDVETETTDVSLDARVDVAAGYTDNVFATKNDKVDDFLAILRPRIGLTAQSDTVRIQLTGRGEIGRFGDSTAEDYEDWEIALGSRARLREGLTFVGGGSYRWDNENRASPDDVNGLEPTEFERRYAYAGLLFDEGSYSFRLAANLSDLDFSDVPSSFGIINNDDRDRTHYEIGGRFGQKLTPKTQTFIQAAYDERDYESPIDDFGFARSSNGYTAAVGVRHSFSPRLTGEVYVGIMEQDFDDPQLEDVGTVDFGAVLDWNSPSGISASFRLDRTVEETTLSESSAYILSSARLSMNVANTRRFSAGLGLRGSHLDYVGLPRSEFVLSSDVWSRYWVNSNLYVGAEYQFAQRSSNRAGFDFDENRFFLNIGARTSPRWRGTLGQPFSLSGADAPGGAYAAILYGHSTVITGLDGPRGRDGTNTADFGDDGSSASALAGYGFVAGRIYLGLELEGTLGGAKWEHFANRDFSVDSRDSFGVNARLGFVTAHSDLVYGRFGLVSTRFRTEYDHDEIAFRSSDREIGLGFGLGLEAAFGKSGFIRTEYGFRAYGDYDVPSGESVFDNFSNTENQFRIGFGFRTGTREESDTPPHTFSGPFIGIQFGHGTLISENTGFRSGGTPIEIARSSGGPLVGLVAGLNFEAGPLILGGEIEADVSNIDWNIERDPTGRIISTEHELSFGAGARVGFRLGDAGLIYGRIGIARTKFDTKFSTRDTSVEETNWQTGPRFGGGVELGLGERTALRFDYSHTDYGRFDIEVDEATDGFDNSENLFRIGVLFRL